MKRYVKSIGAIALVGFALLGKFEEEKSSVEQKRVMEFSNGLENIKFIDNESDGKLDSISLGSADHTVASLTSKTYEVPQDEIFDFDSLYYDDRVVVDLEGGNTINPPQLIITKDEYDKCSINLSGSEFKDIDLKMLLQGFSEKGMDI